MPPHDQNARPTAHLVLIYNLEGALGKGMSESAESPSVLAEQATPSAAAPAHRGFSEPLRPAACIAGTHEGFMTGHTLRTRRFTTASLLTLAASVVLLTASATAFAATLGFFSPAVRLAVAPAAHTTFVAVGDLNGDGNLDIVAVNYSAGNAAVFLAKGGGSFSTPTFVNVGATPKACVLKDMDGNGTLDLVVADEVPNAVAVLKGNGHGGFGTAAMYPTGASSEELAVADLNGDGRPDIVSVNDNAVGLISVLLARSGGGYQLKGPFAAGSNPRDVSAADFNRDGKMDVVVADEGDLIDGVPGDVQLWLGTAREVST